MNIEYGSLQTVTKKQTYNWIPHSACFTSTISIVYLQYVFQLRLKKSLYENYPLQHFFFK